MTGDPIPTGSADPPTFNPLDPGFSANPYPQYRLMVEQNPVQRSLFGPWMLFRYDDCFRFLRDPTLSVEDASVEGVNPRAELRAQVLGDRARRGTRSILSIDPPDHTRIRGIVQRVFTPRAIERLAPRVQELVDDALDAVVTRGNGKPDADMEVVGDLAFPLPFQVISDMLGMPDADRDELRGWAHTLTLGLEPVLAQLHINDIMEASDHMTDHVLEAIEWKRAHPADDLLTALIDAEHEGERLTADELVDQVVLLFVAGHETTVNLIGNGTLALLRNRAQLERWQRDPSIAASAVDELLRYDSPVQFSRRVTTADVEIEGRTIAAGTFVFVVLGSANRDPAHWGDDADTLDLTRSGAAQHLAFGSGIHHCLGAALARLEGRIALGTLVERFPGMELATSELEWNGRLVLRGLDELPVALG
ncbi:MAG: cytochrome P450 [Acidimicrobiia bacterium]